MAKSIIAYDRDLPEIPDRCSWLEPDCHLVRDPANANRYSIQPGAPAEPSAARGPAAEVGKWRTKGYDGASDVTRRLLEYWFQEDHEVPGFGTPFRCHFGQREAIETLVYLIEIARNRDALDLIKSYARIKSKDLFEPNIEFHTTPDGRRRVRRYVGELEREATQDLPPENLRRYACKMATGSGKTWVMAMAIVWAYFHKKMVTGSDLSANFLVVAPNVIVYQRLEKDFGSSRIFHQIPLIPPEWKARWAQKVILRGDSAEPDP